MPPQQWQSIETALADFSVEDKLELVTRLVHVIQIDVSASTEPDRARALRQALDTLSKRLDAMAAAAVSDGLSNRDHDQILYGASS